MFVCNIALVNCLEINLVILFIPKVTSGHPRLLDLSLQLTPGEEMYVKLHDMHISTVGTKLSEETKRISTAYEVCIV